MESVGEGWEETGSEQPGARSPALCNQSPVGLDKGLKLTL